MGRSPLTPRSGAYIRLSANRTKSLEVLPNAVTKLGCDGAVRGTGARCRSRSCGQLCHFPKLDTGPPARCPPIVSVEPAGTSSLRPQRLASLATRPGS